MNLLDQTTHPRDSQVSEAERPSEVGFRLPRRVMLGLVLLVASSCLSPTLPLPPPNKPDVAGPDSTGNVTLSGETIPGANVYANNLNSGASAGQKAHPSTGKYQFRIKASYGDRMEFFYIYDSVSSDRTYFWIGSPVAPVDSTTWPDAGVNFADVDASVVPPR